jgi:hypothetical protein
LAEAALTERLSLCTLRLIFDRLLQVGVWGWLYVHDLCMLHVLLLLMCLISKQQLSLCRLRIRLTVCCSCIYEIAVVAEVHKEFVAAECHTVTMVLLV